MANTYEIIASVTVGSGGAATIDFTSIPATYTDLLIKLSSRSDRSGNTSADQYIQFNGNTSAVYSMRRLLGTGSSASSDSASSDAKGAFVGMATGSTATASTFANTEIYIPNYTSSNAKSISIDSVTENNATEAYQVFNASLWNPVTQAAITSLLIGTYTTNNFVQYSTAYLYGISNA
jgi:hypothetical protein